MSKRSDAVSSGLHVVINLAMLACVTGAWTAAHFWVFQLAWGLDAAVNLLMLVLIACTK